MLQGIKPMPTKTMARIAVAAAILGLVFGTTSAVFGSHDPELGDFPDVDSYVADLLHSGDGCSVDQAAPGDSVTFSAHGFQPGSEVTVTFGDPGVVVFQGTATGSADGSPDSFPFTVPDGVSGEQTVTASGTGSDGAALALQCVINVGGDGGGGGGGALARTGGNTMPLLITGLTLLVLGAAAVYGTRHKRASTSTS